MPRARRPRAGYFPPPPEAPAPPPDDEPPPPVEVIRKFTSSFRSFGLIVWPKVWGITFGGKPGVIFLFGSTIDCLIWAGLMPARTLSRSGPVVPDDCATLSVWQPPQPF